MVLRFRLGGFFGHPQDLLAGHRPDHVRVVALDVSFDIRDQLVVALAADGLAARAVHLLRHLSSSVREAESTPPRPPRPIERAPPWRPPARPPSSTRPHRRPAARL